MTPADLRQFAADLSVEAGTLAMASRDRTMSISTKSSSTDLVTEHDRAAEALLVERIHELRPGDSILGEEGAAATGTTGYTWYLDPIDGTTNYVYGHPMWATSVAVADDDGALAGAVYAPATAELFTAGRGQGATLNGTSIRTSEIADLRLALVATGFGYVREMRVEQARLVAEVIGDIRDIRRGGSAALDLCYVAAGRVDGYYEIGINVWDVAAGELIAREAGCATSWIDAAPGRPLQICAAAPGIFDALRQLVKHGKL